MADTGVADTGLDTGVDAGLDVVAAAPSCQAYCKVVVAHCTGDNAQYKDEAECNNYCKGLGKLPAGTADDKAGNTIGCRTYHAGAAKDDPKTHCSHAGKSGGNACGTWCDNYCHLVDKSCLAAKQDMDVDTSTCLTKCKELKDGGKPNDAGGDSVQCRIYHLGVAGTDEANAKIHCPHGKVAPAVGTPCAAAAPTAPTCENYCKVVAMHCTGENAQYKDEAECVTYCKTQGKLPVGTADDKTVNSVGCRTYHAGAAKDDPKTHCSHAGKSGDNVCGTWAENYCHLAVANCTADNKIFADNAACLAAAATAKKDGKANDAAGDTLQCRIYHLGVAGTDAPSAKTHCPHGGIPGKAGDPCGPAVTAPVTKEVKTTGANTFDPAETSIAVGDSVKFTTGSNHNAIEVDEAAYTAGLPTKKAGAIIDVGFGATATVKFDKAGTYYFVLSARIDGHEGQDRGQVAQAPRACAAGGSGRMASLVRRPSFFLQRRATPRSGRTTNPGPRQRPPMRSSTAARRPSIATSLRTTRAPSMTVTTWRSAATSPTTQRWSGPSERGAPSFHCTDTERSLAPTTVNCTRRSGGGGNDNCWVGAAARSLRSRTPSADSVCACTVPAATGKLARSPAATRMAAPSTARVAGTAARRLSMATAAPGGRNTAASRSPSRTTSWTDSRHPKRCWKTCTVCRPGCTGSRTSPPAATTAARRPSRRTSRGSGH
ncbi:MAG: hypothetical protein FJ100_03925 [Deltaproteobacteria bacterium]|nr:hypothetical protein [Deltaproteobacteria bacterium]